MSLYIPVIKYFFEVALEVAHFSQTGLINKASLY